MSSQQQKTVKIIFIYLDSKKEIEVDADIGLSLLEVAHNNEIAIEGSCGGGLACSTCHVYIESKKDFEELPSATEREEDMLDLAFGYKEGSSRLSCQIIITEELEGLRVIVPTENCNIQ